MITRMTMGTRRSNLLLVLLLLLLLALAHPLQSVATHLSLARSTTALGAAAGSSSTPPLLTAEEAGSRYKRIVYGQGSGAKVSIEVMDRQYRSRSETFLIDRRQGGSLGLELVEAPSGIVFVGSVRDGSVTKGLLQPGDSLILAEGLDGPDAQEPR